MRRIIAVVIAATAVVALASPAWAAGDERAPRQRLRQAADAKDQPIDLACNATTQDDKPAIHCSWNAYDGADAYRVVVAVRRRHALIVRRRRGTETEVPHKNLPGTFHLLVRAVDADHHALARSNAVKVVVPRPAG